MSKLKQLIGLQTSNLSVRALARALDLSIGAVSKYLRAVRAAGIGATDAESLSEAEFELRVLGPTRQRGSCKDPAEPAQVMPLMRKPQRVSSSPAPGVVVGCCRC